MSFEQFEEGCRTRLKVALDRIEEGRLAVLVDERGCEILNLPVDRLPAGSKEGDWLILTLENSEVVEVQPDRRESEARRLRIREKMKRLLADDGEVD